MSGRPLVAGFDASPCDDDAVWAQARACLGTLEHRNRYNVNEVKYCVVMCDRAQDDEIRALIEDEGEEGAAAAGSEKDNEAGQEEEEAEAGVGGDKRNARGPCVYGTVTYVARGTQDKLSREKGQVWDSISDWLERCPWEEVAGLPVCNNCNETPLSARGNANSDAV